MNEIISIVTGEFQLIHAGVYSTLKQALLFCNKLIVCLESEEANPITLEERHKMLEGVLDYLVNIHYDVEEKTYVILDLVDITEGRSVLGIDENDSCIFFTADEVLDPVFAGKLTDFGYEISFCEKVKFSYRARIRQYWIESSTEIREIHRKAMIPIDLTSTGQQLYPWQ